jgi:zinc protease
MKMLRNLGLMLASTFGLTLASPALAAVEITDVTSPAGIKAWLVESHDIPFTSLHIRFQGGSSLDAPGKRGAISLMTYTLEEGAAEMDSQAFAEAREGLAASFSFSVDADGVDIQAQFLTENRDQAVELLRKALQEPRFDQAALDRVKGQMLSNIRANAKDPDDLASKALWALAYPDHPYGSSGDGTEESVTALTRDDILAAHKGVLARDRVLVGAAGDITPDDLGRLVDTLLAALPATGAPMPGTATHSLKPGVTVIDFPGPQSSVLFAQGGIRQSDPDYFAAMIVNEVLGGGGFSSRLMDEVREKRGLTYGVGTSNVVNDHAEMIIGHAAVANANVAQAMEVIRAEWARIAKDGITEQELQDTKTYMTGAYPLRFDGNEALSTIMVGMQSLGLTPDYPKTRNEKVEAVTMEDVKRVAAKLFREGDLRFVVVGQPEGVTATE